MSRRGFSLAEALIAMAIGSLLLMGAWPLSACPAASYSAPGRTAGPGERAVAACACRGKTSAARRVLPGSVRRSRAGASRWRGVSDCALGCEQQREMGNFPAAAAESTGFRLRDGALETLRGASDCRGGGWEKITNPAAIVVTRFSVQRQVTPGFAPELSVTLAARSAQQTGLTSEVEQRVTGYNL